ncbi:MAG TPA: hypothetical protein PKI19_09035 [Elusimicrobiales bacterium]|nr:hypothetical protein [Elusimicrobiales bacterium]
MQPVAAGAQAAVVGGGAVTAADIADWQAAQACYGPEALTSRKAGFMRMFEAAILEEVLKEAAQRPITEADYARETARIDAETRAPDILACIKKYFAGDTARYERVFVRPILAQRFIREHVRTDAAAQAAAYGLRDGILKDIAQKKIFKDIGLARGVAYSTAVYSVAADTAAPAAEPGNRWSPFEAAFIEENLKELKPGGIKAQPVEDERSVKFLRLLSAEGGKYYFEALTVPKLSTEDYLKSVKELPCRIEDKELRDWVAGIKGNPLLAPADCRAAQ